MKAVINWKLVPGPLRQLVGLLTVSSGAEVVGCTGDEKGAGVLAVVWPMTDDRVAACRVCATMVAAASFTLGEDGALTPMLQAVRMKIRKP